MTVASIPNKLYVTLRHRADAGNEDGLLGFASPYTRDAAFLKRKQTQDNWAYGFGTKVEISEDDEITMTTGPNSKFQITEIFIANWYPRIINNEPLEGFEIAKSVRRYGWNGSGNVSWRITDPRGFDLEISSDNFASLVSNCILEKGRILGKCVWGRSGSNNILLHENSEPYQLALKKTSQLNSKLPISAAQPGDIVELVRSKTNDQPMMYMGKYYLLTANPMIRGGQYTTTVSLTLFSSKQTIVHIFKSLDSDDYFCFGNPKISHQIQRADKPLDSEEFAKKAMMSSKNELANIFDNRNDILLVSNSKIDVNKITSKLIPTHPKLSSWPKIGYYNKMLLARDASNTMYLAKPTAPTYYTLNNNGSVKSISTIKVKFDLETNSLIFTNQEKIYPRYSNYISIGQDKNSVDMPVNDIVVDDNLKGYEFFDIEMTLGNTNFIWDKESIL